MEKSDKKKYPPYLPLYYLIFLIIRKAYRQSLVRVLERRAKRRGPQGIVPDGNAAWPRPDTGLPHQDNAINKSARWIDEDMKIPAVQSISHGIYLLKKEMARRGLAYCSPAGIFKSTTYLDRTERTKNWENCWMIAHSGVREGKRVLDLGGASTIFAFYLASMGCDVDVVDNDWGNCGTIFNANYVARKMGWRLKAHDIDLVRRLPFPDNSFDHIFSICVMEHLSSAVRSSVMSEVGRLLKPGGTAGFTTDYVNDRDVLLFDKGLRFAYPDKLRREIIEPSGLQIYGNQDLVDAIGPNENFLGAFFLQKKMR
ncbi:MAG: class I SAM-dependent methyltransferase [Candidatus Omnitrophica bacterium]|nr:class I SAM-dependent methyltransferase [Candidatus Omnitrophota bacterium]MDD5436370.1 class I SAM-dependent methyltransferase [Candidatus Omnitrophota bacterium]